MSERRTIRTDYLARVEGEGALSVLIDRGQVQNVELSIFEPPRFFEAMLRGRDFTEAPDITSRICGICPIAYQTSSINAMEFLTEVEVPEPIRLLRRLLYLGEWIESHSLHVYMLHGPDFLGYAGAVEIARDHPQIVERGLGLKKVGNEVMQTIGGREIHPVNMRVGGFYRAPSKRELSALTEPLKRSLEAALETVRWVSGFEFPEREVQCDLVALYDPVDYAVERGRIHSTGGLDISPAEYEEHFQEEHVERSTALHSRIIGGGAYLCGPLARYTLNHEQLTPLAKEAAKQAGLGEVERNPFKSIIVRSVELVYACEEALRIIEGYEPPVAPAVSVKPREGTGYGASEAPRGMLFHRYHVAADGTIRDAKIVPPTSQNQKAIEEDLHAVVSANIDLDDDRLQHLAEQTIRNYDPCISCSTHFLRLEVQRT